MNNIFKRVWKGVAEGNSLEMVPKHVKEFNNLKLVKFFRFAGIFSTTYLLSSDWNILKKYNIYDLNEEIFYIAMFFSFIYIIYRVVYTFYVIKETYYIFKNKKYYVINSPRDPLATMIKAGWVALKSGVQATVGTGLLFTMANEIDDLSESSGRARVLIPALNRGIAKKGLNDTVDTFLNKFGFTKVKPTETVETQPDILKLVAKEFNVKEEDLKISLENLQNRKSLSEEETTEVVSTIKK